MIAVKTIVMLGFTAQPTITSVSDKRTSRISRLGRKDQQQEQNVFYAEPPTFCAGKKSMLLCSRYLHNLSTKGSEIKAIINLYCHTLLIK